MDDRNVLSENLCYFKSIMSLWYWSTSHKLKELRNIQNCRSIVYDMHMTISNKCVCIVYQYSVYYVLLKHYNPKMVNF